MSNDHYVPQFFLRAWSFDTGRNKVYRYKRIPQRNHVEFKEASIRSIASLEDIYSIRADSESFSFETLIMSRALDDGLAKVVSKFREASLAALDDNERDQLGRLVLTLEARNPTTIESMKLSATDIHRIAMKVTNQASLAARNEIKALLESMGESTGAWAAGSYVSWAYGPDLQALKGKRWTEVCIEGKRPFVTSDYPTLLGTTAPYNDERHISSLAMAPDKALLIARVSFFAEFKQLELQLQCRYINLLTIAGASEAYTDQNFEDPWIARHLGWARTMEHSKRAEYFAAALAE